jgi:hypothetical protein
MKNNILKIGMAFLGIMLSACLDDDKYALDPSSTQNVIEFMDPSVPVSPVGSIYPAYATSFVLAPSAEFVILASFSGPQSNSQDIDLTFTVDPAALIAYNQQQHDDLHGPTFELMPEANYDMASMTTTIPSGQTKVPVTITVYPENFDFSKNYAIPLRIQSSSHGVLSAHYSVAILGIGVRNLYDGVYDITGGNIQRNSATGPDPALSGNYVPDLQIELNTITSNAVAFAPVWKDGSGIAGIDGTSITIIESPDVNGNYPITFASSNPLLKAIPGAENFYNPTTKEFTININWGTAPSTRVITGMKLKYNSPRP